MDFGERLKRVRKGRYNQEELASLIGVHTNTISRWENGSRSPDAGTLQKLAQALDTTTAYLLGEVDDPARLSASQPTSKTVVLSESNVRNVRGKLVNIPVLAPQSSVCCGKGFSLADVEAEVDWWEPIPEAWLTGTKGDKPFFITHVEGDSMEPMIEDGERILINPNQEVAHGDVAIVCWNGRSMVRGVKFERDGAVRLVPVNKSYAEDVISKEDKPFVLEFGGVVVRFLGKDRVSRGIL